MMSVNSRLLIWILLFTVVIVSAQRQRISSNRFRTRRPFQAYTDYGRNRFPASSSRQGRLLRPEVNSAPIPVSPSGEIQLVGSRGRIPGALLPYGTSVSQAQLESLRDNGPETPFFISKNKALTGKKEPLEPPFPVNGATYLNIH